MKKYLFIYAVCVTTLLVWGYTRQRTEINRLQHNQSALLDQATYYRTRDSLSAASVEQLELTRRELERHRSDLVQQCKTLKIKVRQLKSLATTATVTEMKIQVPMRDTIILHDTLRLFRWCDPWTTIEGTIARDSIACRVESVDTLHQIVHRIPHQFLFFRWGCKAIRQEVVSSNPHTRIVHAEYVKIER
ncbi:MAG: DUF6549 family protein [Alistipes sp.]